MADLTSGLTTRIDQSSGTPELRVDWIGWASPFRGTDLQIGDCIVAMNAAAVDASVAGAATSRMVGQPSEPDSLAATGLKSGALLRLKVCRRAFPKGWKEIEVAAPLTEVQPWRNADNREILGPDGPVTMENDGFSSGGWGGWAELFQNKIRYLLDRDQHTTTFVSRFEWKQFANEHGERVKFAVANYPGRWARAVKADYDAALELTGGKPVQLAPGALEFRRRGEEMAAEVRTKALADWNAFQSVHAAETIPAFPTLNPASDNVAPLKNKIVVLPEIGNGEWVSDTGHGWFAVGNPDGDGWYFIDAESDDAVAMLRAQRQYAKLVDPNLNAKWQFIARVTTAPRLGVVGERAHFGLICEPLAALVGGSMFVDLTARKGLEVSFSGEAGLIDDHPTPPPDSASPSEVVAALVGAVKTDNLELWKALHSPWWTEWVDDGKGGMVQILHPIGLTPEEDRFEDCRRSIMGRVLDARVEWEGEPRVVIPAGRYEGAVAVEQVDVWLDHVGNFDGDVRTFNDTTVSGRWSVQRLGAGPWRIGAVQPI